MQVEVDMKCTETKFDGCGLSGFGDIANWLKKFMQVEVGVKCMQSNFGGFGLSSPWGPKNRIGSKNSCK